MDEKDIEKKLKESAESIEVRDYSLIWKDIEDRIVDKPKKGNKKISKWISIVAAAACLVLTGSIAIPIALNQHLDDSETTYYWEELEARAVQKIEFYEKLQTAKVEYVDFDKYAVSSYVLFETRDGNTKGGMVELSDNIDEPTFLLTVQFYDNSVQVAPSQVEYNLNYSINGATVEYRVKEFYPEDGVYIYDIKANQGKTNYFMEYTCFTEDIKPFLNDFFLKS